MEKTGVNPLLMLLHIASGNWKALGYKKGTKQIVTPQGKVVTVDRIDIPDRRMAATDASKYFFTQLKSVEVELGKDANKVAQSFTQLMAQVANGDESEEGV